MKPTRLRDRIFRASSCHARPYLRQRVAQHAMWPALTTNLGVMLRQAALADARKH